MPLRRLRAATVLVLLATALVGVAPADAKVTRKKSIWGPVTYDGRSAFPIYADLGVGIYQTAIAWSTVAPTRPADHRNPADPAYRWPREVGYAIRQGRRHGIKVAMSVSFTPPWANGNRAREWAPTKPRDYADFMVAAARRWPAIRHWLVWGEPTRQANFMPNPAAAEAQAPAKPTRANVAGARRYARILDASYRALKRVRRSNLIIGGNSFITGDVGPYNWTRFVKLPSGRPPRMDMWGHNPFGSREPRLSRPSVGPGLADFSDLEELAKWLDRHQRRGRRRLPLFLSEYQIPTDQPNYEFNFYATRATQARYITSAMRIVRRWDRIYTLGYHRLEDEQPNATGDEVRRGLIDAQGDRKPGYYAFKRG